MSTRATGRLLSGARAAYGALLVAAPERSPELSLDTSADPIVRSIVRVLGARHLAQATLTALHPTARTLRAGVVVDGLHAASMVALARVSPDDRRPALISAASATGFAVAGVVAMLTGSTPPTDA